MINPLNEGEGIMELEIIAWLQEYFFQGIIWLLSYAGHLFVVLGFAVIVYLVVDKRLGAKVFVFYFTAMGFNAFLKVRIGRPRPYTKGAHTIIEKSLQHSMPSGHAQGFAALCVPFARRANTLKGYLIAAGLIVFLCFTRIYLGQHYLSDVLAGATIGLAIAAILELAYVFLKDRADIVLMALIPIFITLMAVFNGESYRDAFVSCGFLIGALVGIFFEKRYVKYEINGGIVSRVLKVLFSLVVTSLVILPPVLLRGVLHENLFIVILFTLMGASITLLCPFLIKLVFDKKTAAADNTVAEEVSINETKG